MPGSFILQRQTPAAVQRAQHLAADPEHLLEGKRVYDLTEYFDRSLPMIYSVIPIAEKLLAEQGKALCKLNGRFHVTTDPDMTRRLDRPDKQRALNALLRCEVRESAVGIRTAPLHQFIEYLKADLEEVS